MESPIFWSSKRKSKEIPREWIGGVAFNLEFRQKKGLLSESLNLKKPVVNLQCTT
jgi:hypothetical protein